jgi:hypothetical protein
LYSLGRVEEEEAGEGAGSVREKAGSKLRFLFLTVRADKDITALNQSIQ